MTDKFYTIHDEKWFETHYKNHHPNATIINVREYGEGPPVAFDKDEQTGRDIIIAFNEGGYNNTQVDARDVYEFLKEVYENASE